MGFWGAFNTVLIKRVVNLLPHVRSGDLSILIVPVSLIVVSFIIFDNIPVLGLFYIRGKFIPVIINRIIGETMDCVLGKSHQFYQDNLSGKISNQIMDLAEGIERIIFEIAWNFLRNASLLLTAFIAAYFVNPVFYILLVTWFMLLSSASIVMSKKFVSLSDAQASANSIVVGELVDSLSNHASVRIFTRKSYEKSRMIPFFGEKQKSYTATYFYTVIVEAIQAGLVAIMLAFSAYFLVYLYGKNLVTIGDFVLIIGLFIETSDQIGSAMSAVYTFNQEVGKCRQSLTSLMTPLEVQDTIDAVPLQCKRGQIVFDNVKFHYKSAGPLFQNKSVEIKAGQKIGLVGYSGSGKSTFVHLILRLYDVTDGAILIDGQDIRDVTQYSLRENIAMIPQDPSLFHRSLMDNIRYGKIDATDEKVIEAAKKTHAHEFISKLPQGYDSLVGERGVKLSGGQRQSISIARAILKNAPILILDEATSQLDSVTENLIQDSFWELMQGKTTIVIAHRLSTLLHMDRILVFDKGKIVEDGSHNALLAKDGLYKQLWDTQVGGFLGDKKRENEG